MSERLPSHGERPWDSILVPWLLVSHAADGTLAGSTSIFRLVPYQGSNDNVDFQFNSEVAGTAQFRVNSRTANTPGQLVGGMAVARNASANTVIGIGWQTADAGTWDLDLGDPLNNGGYDLHLKNSNISGEFRVNAGNGIKLGVGTGNWGGGGTTEYMSITAAFGIRLSQRFIQKLQTPTYGTSVTIGSAINTGNIFQITATDGVGFTITNPSNADAGQIATFMIRNASGGVLGAVTWDTLYKLATWTSPANGFSRSISFVSDGTNWVEVGRTTADVPN